ncbi:Hypothetical predicted protein [Podarcis lilfordi]|uniref:Uncharacterized protein n=1 Tax=Podarcis lilfordi TaxID=74358 RepID=A0AA35NXS6_9SAUR|nr:Hypothetical predicted protein [Podarcis lilfordi]
MLLPVTTPLPHGDPQTRAAQPIDGCASASDGSDRARRRGGGGGEALISPPHLRCAEALLRSWMPGPRSKAPPRSPAFFHPSPLRDRCLEDRRLCRALARRFPSASSRHRSADGAGERDPPTSGREKGKGIAEKRKPRLVPFDRFESLSPFAEAVRVMGLQEGL